MRKKAKRTKGIEEARPFEGLSRVNENAAGVDIGASEIVACVSGGDDVQLKLLDWLTWIAKSGLKVGKNLLAIARFGKAKNQLVRLL